MLTGQRSTAATVSTAVLTPVSQEIPEAATNTIRRAYETLRLNSPSYPQTARCVPSGGSSAAAGSIGLYRAVIFRRGKADRFDCGMQLAETLNQSRPLFARRKQP
jgi:hypothetical protein